MANTRSNLVSVGEILGLKSPEFSFINPPLVTAPNSSITDMSGVTRKLPDPSKTARPNMGIERVMTQSVILLQDERGSNGEQVFAALNDDSNRIRFVGGLQSLTNSYGSYINSVNVGDFVEITFYGTGLNAILAHDGSARDNRVTINGGAESGNIFSGSYSAVIGNRNYAQNLVFSIMSNQTLGIHTVKIRNNSANGLSIYGFEIIGNTTSISIPQGELYASGKKFTNPTAQTLAYNSGFDGSPSLNGRGGRVVTYLSENGILGKVIQQVNGAQANLTAADHTNEEVTRTYSHREFGAGRTDDYSLLAATSGIRAFTLDDGTTTLVSSNSAVTQTSQGLVVGTTNGDFTTLTFVGTGLDIARFDSATGGADTFSVSINGATAVSLSTTGLNSDRIQKIVSGLPYGTHTARFQRTSVPATYDVLIKRFIVYGPKKPTIPSGSIELADYNLVADFVANTTAGVNTISTGALRKAALREMVYVNGTGGSTDWTVPAADPTYISGFGDINSNRLNAYVEYTFFGTGFDLRFAANSNRTANITLTLNGTLMTTGNFGTMVNSNYGGGSFTAGTGILSQSNGSLVIGSGFRTSGLPLAKYTVRFNNNTASSFIIIDSFDIITPIHSPKSNLYADLQNTLAVGSNALSFSSKHGSASPTATKAWAQAVGVAATPTTTSTTAVPCPDMSTTIKTNGGSLEINFSLSWFTSGGTGNRSNFFVFVNGVQIGAGIGQDSQNASSTVNSTIVSVIVPVSAGTHKVDGYWSASGGATLSALNTNRSITVQEK